jgi:hypothetical protein
MGYKHPIFGVFCSRQRKIHGDRGRGAQICCFTICNITLHLSPLGQVRILRNFED